ncbi:MAG: PilZ domain-containing protein [Burkholderiales bacterium]|nr:PilZ domain-containing protein [Burkholderiales bacterium]
MIELRKSPRINVNWRAGIKLPDGRLMLGRAINLSAEGVLLLCPEHLTPLRTYTMLLEIPSINGSDEIYKVHCKASIRHAILSGDAYRVGIQLSEMSQLHEELVNAWFSKTAQTAVAK